MSDFGAITFLFRFAESIVSLIIAEERKKVSTAGSSLKKGSLETLSITKPLTNKISSE